MSGTRRLRSTHVPAARRTPNARPCGLGSDPVASEPERRQRIEAEALVRAVRDGDFRIREIVEQTGISSRTIYRYYPSKEFLLLAALIGRADALESFVGSPPTGKTAAERVDRFFEAPTRAFVTAPSLAKAMIRALTRGRPESVPLLHAFQERLLGGIIDAIGDELSPENAAATGLVLEQAWFAAVLSWAVGYESPEYIMNSVRAGIRLLLSDRD